MRAYAIASLCFFAIAACDDEPTPTPDATAEVTDTAVAETIADAGPDDTATAPDEVNTPDQAAELPPEIIAPDVGPELDAAPDVPAAPDNCLEQYACLAVACQASPAADLGTCFTDAAAGCGVADDGSDVESDYATALAVCAATNECVPDGSGDMYNCLLDNCVTESAVCYAGPTFGADDSCFDLRSCTLVECKPGITGLPDYDCLRECSADYDQAAVEGYLSLQYCLDANCSDAPDKEVCYTQMQSNPLCSSYSSNCPDL